MCKNFLFIFCLFFLLHPLHATRSFNIDWNKLDNSLNMLEWNLKEAETTISQLQTQLEEQQKYSANQQLQYKTLEDKYQQLEKTTNFWKATSITLMIVCSVCSIIGAIAIWQ